MDPFGYTQERRVERRLVDEYEATIVTLVGAMSPGNRALAVQIAQVPDDIRGYGHIKDASIAIAKAREADLLDKFRSGTKNARERVAA